jgi:putative ABC transport system permease protein
VLNFLLETLRLGLANLSLHKLRSLLTALGIIFGVGAVITMVAIGEGNKRRALADITRLGVNNIIVRSVKPPESTSTAQGNNRVLSYGIKRLDLRRIEASVLGLSRIVPLKQIGTVATNSHLRATVAAFGTTPQLRDVMSLQIERGRYITTEDDHRLDNVAVIGAEVAQRLFALEDPLGADLRIERQVFRVVGVLRRVGLAGGAGAALVGRDLNLDIHVPIATAEARFGDTNFKLSGGTAEITQVELSEVYLQAAQPQSVRSVAEQVQRIIDQTHATSGDVSLVVPLELLDQRERQEKMFNTLMAAIASISLLVGGIGIMNIMLASVTERTREIGIRRALGATRFHIVAQFLVETTVLSGLGGILGVTLGVLSVAALSFAFEARWLTAIENPQVTPWSVVVSLLVATGVGIGFGLYPAVQAARQDPIQALRHD